MNFSIKQIAEAVDGSLSGDGSVKCSGVGIDTRTFIRGNLFVAVKGAHFDGHDFLGDAVGAGASALVVKKGSAVPRNVPFIEVQDTVDALGAVAKWWRGRFNAPCVAITGSNGKSTTKEMASAICGSRGPVLKTEGNFNNLIGLPLTVFRWDDSHRTAVLEMGMNAPGEIYKLSKIARPDIGLITNVTAAHLEKLHTVEAVARAKAELFEAMDGGTTAIVNDEDPWVKRLSSLHRGKKITFGMQNSSDIRFLHMDMEGLDSMDIKVSVMGRECRLRLRVPGSHNVMNALSALAVGAVLGIGLEDAVPMIETFKPMALRFERVQLASGVRIVNDSYNANPESMRAAFRTVGSAKRAGRFIAALGDMLELGEASAELHECVGRGAVEMGVRRLYVLGDFSESMAAGAVSAGLDASDIIECENAEQMARLLEEDLRTGDVLLVKGSRGMKMERVVEQLKTAFGTD